MLRYLVRTGTTVTFGSETGTPRSYPTEAGVRVCTTASWPACCPFSVVLASSRRTSQKPTTRGFQYVDDRKASEMLSPCRFQKGFLNFFCVAGHKRRKTGLHRQYGGNRRRKPCAKTTDRKKRFRGISPGQKSGSGPCLVGF